MNRIAPRLIKRTRSQLDLIAEKRIREAVQESGKEIERVAPKITKSAIKKIYKMPFRLLGSFGRKKYKQLKQKVIQVFKNGKVRE